MCVVCGDPDSASAHIGTHAMSDDMSGVWDRECVRACVCVCVCVLKLLGGLSSKVDPVAQPRILTPTTHRKQAHLQSYTTSVRGRGSLACQGAE